MSNNSKNGVNGASTLNGTTKTATAAPAVEIKKEETPKIESQPRTLVEQRARAVTLNDLFEKEEKLTGSRQQLKSFVAASDEDTNKLELRDGKGRAFATGNPHVIAEVVKLVLATLDSKITEVQMKIINA